MTASYNRYMKTQAHLYFCLLFVLFKYPLQSQPSLKSSTLIQHVWIIDGTGAPAKKGSVRISGNQIIAVGNLQPLVGEQLIDGKNQYLCPGFIDSHSHHFGSLKKEPTGIAMTNQGITTIVIGQDGDSHPMDSLAAFSNSIKLQSTLPVTQVIVRLEKKQWARTMCFENQHRKN